MKFTTLLKINPKKTPSNATGTLYQLVGGIIFCLCGISKRHSTDKHSFVKVVLFQKAATQSYWLSLSDGGVTAGITITSCWSTW